MTDHDSTLAASAHQEVTFDRMAGELRRLLDAIAAAAPDAGLAAAAADDLSALADRFATRAVPPAGRVMGTLELPGRGQALVPTLHVEAADDDRVTGTVRFGPFHQGTADTAHGGAIAMFLEEVLGYLAVSGRTGSLTASLQLDYRSATLIDRDLRVEAWFDREDGRKRFLRATLHDGETLCVEARALCIALRTEHQVP